MKYLAILLLGCLVGCGSNESSLAGLFHFYGDYTPSISTCKPEAGDHTEFNFQALSQNDLFITLMSGQHLNGEIKENSFDVSVPHPDNENFTISFVSDEVDSGVGRFSVSGKYEIYCYSLFLGQITQVYND